MKRVLAVMMLGVLVSGCGQRAAEDAVDAPQSQASQPVNSPSEPEAAPQQNIRPTLSTTFASQEACVEAGYGQAQCARAYSTAQAMASVDRPVYSSINECKALFSYCLGDEKGSQFAPGVVGFSIGNEAKTQNAPPTASVQAPLFHAPIFKNKEGENVFIVSNADKSIKLEPLKDASKI